MAVAATTVPIRDTEELGQIMRLARRFQRLRQDEVGRFSHSFIGEVEMGKPTAQIGKVFEALRELGLKIHVELPPGIPESAVHEVMMRTR
jgi:HTH-type transcriptional regulator/antitoxin HipB